jgi:O-antigen/teichoic acid export membrane protein
MKRFFVKNLFFVILVNVLIKPFWVFFIDRTVQNKVGYTQFGTYWALLNTTLVFQIILDMGILNYTNKTIAQSNDQVGKLFSSTLFAKLILFALYASIILGLSFSLQHTAQERYLLMGIIGIQFLNSFLQYIRSIISALHFFKLDGIVSILDKLLMIGICGILFLNSKTSAAFNIHWFVIAQLGSYLISVIIALWILKLLYKKPFWSRINRARIVQIIKDSLPYAALIFLMSIYMRSDALLLERLHPN